MPDGRSRRGRGRARNDRASPAPTGHPPHRKETPMIGKRTLVLGIAMLAAGTLGIRAAQAQVVHHHVVHHTSHPVHHGYYWSHGHYYYNGHVVSPHWQHGHYYYHGHTVVFSGLPLHPSHPWHP